jgi:Holliday junction DNA helicase RuvA
MGQVHMISSIQGRVAELNDDHAVVEINGVGIQVFVPAPTRARMRIGESVILYTSLVVRQDALSLYGFENREHRNYFQILLGVSGIGPRSSLAIISVLDPESINRAVFNQQPEMFARVPGIGKKTAQKIILHLQDRLPGEPGLEPLAALGEVNGEVLNALTSLGYSIVEAQRAIQSIPSDASQELEERIKIALSYFAKP